jgi:monomeric isocitrate dehydrogenase
MLREQKKTNIHGQTCEVEEDGQIFMVRYVEKDRSTLMAGEVEKDELVRHVQWKKTEARSWSDMLSRKRRAPAHGQTCEVEKDGRTLMLRHYQQKKTDACNGKGQARADM